MNVAKYYQESQRQHQLNQRDAVVQALSTMPSREAMEYLEESLSLPTLRDILVGYLDWNSSQPDQDAKRFTEDLFYQLGLDQPTSEEDHGEEIRYFNRYQR
jgi:uncharacterized membrane protein YccC